MEFDRRQGIHGDKIVSVKTVDIVVFGATPMLNCLLRPCVTHCKYVAADEIIVKIFVEEAVTFIECW